MSKYRVRWKRMVKGPILSWKKIIAEVVLVAATFNFLGDPYPYTLRLVVQLVESTVGRPIHLFLFFNQIYL